MAKISIREAVKIYDVSRPTLTKALKIGKLSGSKGGKGIWEIDQSELARVYQLRKVTTENADGHSPASLTIDKTMLAEEVDVLRAKLAEAEQRAAVAEALAEERADRISDLRRMLPSPIAQRKKQWWQW